MNMLSLTIEGGQHLLQIVFHIFNFLIAIVLLYHIDAQGSGICFYLFIRREEDESAGSVGDN